MLGMYVHTHWGYHRPYAARSWTVSDWEHYLAGLAGLGYDLVMIWPQLDCMPPVPTAGDRAFLDTIAQAIDVAHARFGMRVAVIVCPNTIGNDQADRYEFHNRPYFVCEKKVNPKDRDEVDAFIQGRRNQFEPLRAADALVVIDSDPGGYIGSTNDEFVDLCRRQAEMFREFNPSAEFVYWMLCGWENYNRFWARAQTNDPAEMWGDWRGDDFPQTLALMRDAIPEPWSVFAWRDEHLSAVESLGLDDKVLLYPYAVVEGEPTFPLTNCNPPALAEALKPDYLRRGPRGVMANAQTHCLQLPHTYLFAHFARGGTLAAADLAGFADAVVPNLGDTVASAWLAIETADPAAQRDAARALRNATGRAVATGRLSGLLIGDPDRFLIDLAMNLELRAALQGFADAVDAGRGPAGLRCVLDVLQPYQRRLGFVDAYGGPLHEAFNDVLGRLGDPGLDAVLRQFHDWRDPGVRNGIVPRLLDAADACCRAHGA